MERKYFLEISSRMVAFHEDVPFLNPLAPPLKIQKLCMPSQANLPEASQLAEWFQRPPRFCQSCAFIAELLEGTDICLSEFHSEFPANYKVNSKVNTEVGRSEFRRRIFYESPCEFHVSTRAWTSEFQIEFLLNSELMPL